MKKTISILVIVILVCGFVIPVLAADTMTALGQQSVSAMAEDQFQPASSASSEEAEIDDETAVNAELDQESAALDNEEDAAETAVEKDEESE